MAVDRAKLKEFVNRAVADLGAGLSAALVVLGDRLGLYRAMAGAGPLTPAELAGRTGTAERYVREWLLNQAAGGYVTYDPAAGTYALPAEQALALADEDSEAFLPGNFQVMAAAFAALPRLEECFRTGAGLAWGEQDALLFEGRALLPLQLPQPPRRPLDPGPRRGRGEVAPGCDGGGRRLWPGHHHDPPGPGLHRFAL